MSVLDIIMAAAGSAGTDKVYVDDVFSAYTYTGNGGTQTINNGIDLAGKGGLVWCKFRNTALGSGDNQLFDTQRGVLKGLMSNSTSAEVSMSNSLTTFNSNGFSLGSDTLYGDVNYSTAAFISWTFRKATKFFDVVTYTGDGVAGRTIAHSLGVAPGMIIVKCTSTSSHWVVYHRSTTSDGVLILNTTAAVITGTPIWNATEPTASSFSVNDNSFVNTNGVTYVAYLFAHDTTADGIVQCGSFTTDGSGNATVDLGWEPQYLMTKSPSEESNWYIEDIMRGASETSFGVLFPNLNTAEIVSTINTSFTPISTGFKFHGSESRNYIYLAIRRPSKPPTSGTQVYNAIARTGTGAAATVTGVGFAPDLVIPYRRDTSGSGGVFIDRFRGIRQYIQPNTANVEATATPDCITTLTMDGMSVGADTDQIVNTSTRTYINWFLKRAPEVFDEVCYTGTGVARTVAHNLGVVPELMIVKNRNNTNTWSVYFGDTTHWLSLNSTMASDFISTGFWDSTYPTASVFTLGIASNVNNNTNTFIAYLFATKAGISKVGSFTGNGASLNLDMGFASGARFFLCKRTDAKGDWYLWDSVRGIVTGNDPHLSLNTTAAEVTGDDSVDLYSAGITVNQNSTTNINVNGGSYIYLAFA